jgi:hypothetical protein
LDGKKKAIKNKAKSTSGFSARRVALGMLNSHRMSSTCGSFNIPRDVDVGFFVKNTDPQKPLSSLLKIERRIARSEC